MMAFIAFVTALAIATCAAWFSVLGIVAVFSGTPVAAAIMASCLEVGKLVTASWLHQNWNNGHRSLRWSLLSMTVVLMFITSMGIFGFLSKSFMAHNVTSSLEQDKIALVESQVDTLLRQRESSAERLKQLDAYVDIYLKSTNVSEARMGVRLAGRQESDRKALQDEIVKLDSQVIDLKGSLNELTAGSREIEREIGPVVYLAEFLYGSRDNTVIDKAVRIMIGLIMFAFDPLAILLLIAAQVSWANRPRRKTAEPVPETPVIVDPEPTFTPRDTYINEILLNSTTETNIIPGVDIPTGTTPWPEVKQALDESLKSPAWTRTQKILREKAARIAKKMETK